MVNIIVKELQMVFLTSTVINSNGNMKELECKIKCEKLMFRSRVFNIAVANADFGSLKCHLQFLNKCLCHRLGQFEHYRIIRSR